MIHVYYVVPMHLLGTITICMLDEYRSIIVWDEDLIILRELWLDHLELTIIRILRLLLDLELRIKLLCILLLVSLVASLELPLISIRPLIRGSIIKGFL